MQFFSGEVFVCWYKPPFCITCAGKEKKAGRRSQCSRCPLSEWTPWRQAWPSISQSCLLIPYWSSQFTPYGLGSFSFSGFQSEWVKEPFSAFRLSSQAVVPALASHESTRPFRNEWAFVSVVKNPVIDSAAIESKPIESATAGTVSGVQIAVVGIFSAASSSSY